MYVYSSCMLVPDLITEIGDVVLVFHNKFIYGVYIACLNGALLMPQCECSTYCLVGGDVVQQFENIFEYALD